MFANTKEVSNIKMVYIIDIDNTITETNGDDYENAKPIKERIDKINELYDKGNTIIYWTARGSESGISWDKLTRKQLNDWGAKYKSLGFKQYADFIIDDKVVNSKDFFK
jgi:histidinol phosphatase-like enzyme